MRLRFLLHTAALGLATLMGVSLLSAALLDLYDLVRPAFYREGYSAAAAYDGDRAAARAHFNELHRLQLEYHPFVAWRYQPFSGETITVDLDGRRRTPQAAAEGAPVLGVFGGSTVWGMGAPDHGTLPAALASLADGRWRVVNHGQIGYNSRQDLDALISSLSRGEALDLAVLYSGVNDVATHCRADVSLPGHMDEELFRRRLQPRRWWLPRLFLEPPAGVVAVAARKLGLGESAPWLCHEDPHRARAVAEEILGTWRAAHALARSRGIEAVGVLQPVATIGEPERRGVDLTSYPGLPEELEAVYRELARRIEESGEPWLVDLTGALDGGPVAYFDLCHLAPDGNRRVAEALYRELAERGLLPFAEPPSPAWSS